MLIPPCNDSDKKLVLYDFIFVGGKPLSTAKVSPISDRQPARVCVEDSGVTLVCG